METLVGVDSNALTYLIQAMAPEYEPNSDASGLAPERIAMIQSYLYAGCFFHVLPSVTLEYNRIRSDPKREAHARTCAVLLSEGPWELDENCIRARVAGLLPKHPSQPDCRILAEAEAAQLGVLLTCDGRFLDKLAGDSQSVSLLRPTSYWSSLNIWPGAKPIWSPDPSNPLSRKRWWRLPER